MADHCVWTLFYKHRTQLSSFEDIEKEIYRIIQTTMELYLLKFIDIQMYIRTDYERNHYIQQTKNKQWKTCFMFILYTPKIILVKNTNPSQLHILKLKKRIELSQRRPVIINTCTWLSTNSNIPIVLWVMIYTSIHVHVSNDIHVPCYHNFSIALYFMQRKVDCETWVEPRRLFLTRV